MQRPFVHVMHACGPSEIAATNKLANNNAWAAATSISEGGAPNLGEVELHTGNVCSQLLDDGVVLGFHARRVL